MTYLLIHEQKDEYAYPFVRILAITHTFTILHHLLLKLKFIKW